MATHSPDPIGDADDYDVLPQAIKDVVSRREWAWLSADERRRFMDNETEPEHDQ